MSENPKKRLQKKQADWYAPAIQRLKKAPAPAPLKTVVSAIVDEGGEESVLVSAEDQEEPTEANSEDEVDTDKAPAPDQRVNLFVSDYSCHVTKVSTTKPSYDNIIVSSLEQDGRPTAKLQKILRDMDDVVVTIRKGTVFNSYPSDKKTFENLRAVIALISTPEEWKNINEILIPLTQQILHPDYVECSDDPDDLELANSSNRCIGALCTTTVCPAQLLKANMTSMEFNTALPPLPVCARYSDRLRVCLEALRNLVTWASELEWYQYWEPKGYWTKWVQGKYICKSTGLLLTSPPISVKRFHQGLDYPSMLRMLYNEGQRLYAMEQRTNHITRANGTRVNVFPSSQTIDEELELASSLEELEKLETKNRKITKKIQAKKLEKFANNH